MQTLQLEIQDNMTDKIMWLLNNFKGVKVKNITNEDTEDIKLFEEAKKDKKDIKSIDDMLQEYNIA
ncbi:MAG: hypothetical protein U9Q30_04610 [Campylobacterota bacterium]|nr:hypothetical protein [Campylobacterota bacterium]